MSHKLRIAGNGEMHKSDLVKLRRQYADLDNYAAWKAAGEPCPAEDWPSDEEAGVEGERVGEWERCSIYGQSVRTRKVNGLTEISLFGAYSDAAHGGY